MQRLDASVGTTAFTRSVDQPKDWTDVPVRQRLGKAGWNRSPVEGIWRINEDRYRVAIARTGDDCDKLIGVVLTTTSDAWRPGQIKPTLMRRADGGFDIAYRAGNHAELALAGTA